VRPEGFESLTRNRTSALKTFISPLCGKPVPVPPGAAQTAEKSADLGMRKEREASCTGASRLPRTAGAVAFGTRKADPRIFEGRHRRDRPQFSRFAAPGASEQLFLLGDLREDANNCEKRGGSDADAHSIWLQLGGCHATAREPPKERTSPRQPHRRRNGATASARRS